MHVERGTHLFERYEEDLHEVMVEIAPNSGNRGAAVIAQVQNT